MRKTSCRQEYVRWKSALECEGGRGGCSCLKGHHLLYSEGSGELPSGKIILTSHWKNHSAGSGRLPRGKLIPRGLRDFPRGEIILRGLGDLPGGNNHLSKV